MPFILVLVTIVLCGCTTIPTPTTTTTPVVVVVRQPVHYGEKQLPGLIFLEGRGTFFKPGATKHEVNLVMGAPTKINGNIWFYGDSTVTFSVSVRVPVVTGYYVRSVPLRIYDKDPFSLP